MKVVFNGKDCGFGNNGGSNTLIKSSAVLANLGAEVVLFGPYKHSWNDRPKNVTIIESGKIPTCDVIVATGQSTVPSTLEHKRCNKKFWWVRGHEVWSTSEGDLVKKYKNIKCIVNSKWLKELIKSKTGKSSPVVYQGVDFNLWKNEKPWEERKIQVGGLYSTRHKTKNHHLLEQLEKKGYIVNLLNRDIKNPSYEELKNWYNNIKVWVSPSVLEGLHNPPVEAGMSGCALVTNDNWKAGVSDYSKHNYNTLTYNSEKNELPQIEDFVQRYLKESDLGVLHNKRLQKDIVSKIGSRKENMKKMFKIFEQ